MSGGELSVVQDALAESWNKHGPDAVYTLRVARFDRDLLEQLVMANIGKRAQDLEHP